MSYQNLINEYASAIYELADETNQIDKYITQLNDVVTAFNQNDDFFKMFLSLAVDNSIKKEIIHNVFDKAIDAYILNFMYYLIDKNSEAYLIRIIEKVISFMDDKLNKLFVKIYSPFCLDEKAVAAINLKLKQRTHRDPISTVIIDPNLIGGIKVEYDSNILDNSIETKIKNIKYAIKGDQ